MSDFFYKVKKGINKGTTVISVKSSTMIETNRLKGEITALRKTKADVLQSIGLKMYSMKQEGNIELSKIDNYIKKLTEIDEAIKIKEEAISESLKKQEDILKTLDEDNVRHVNICSCGASILKGTKFCSKCGKKIEEPAPEIIIEEEAHAGTEK